jgi:hypothetical protein
MAEHALITGYLDQLARRLPAEVIDELADGLSEDFQRQRQGGLDPDEAASAVLAQFGTPARVTAAFARNAPGRRTAVRLLATGPVLAALWAASLITAHASTWPVPLAAKIGFGTVLLITAGSLATVALSNDLGRIKLVVPAALALMLLDATMVATVVAAVATSAPVATWPMALAIPASLARIALAAPAVPRGLFRSTASVPRRLLWPGSASSRRGR